MLMVCGHPRSGTTMLTRLLSSHPDIDLTFELHNFMGVGRSPWQHLGLLRRNNRWRLPPFRIRGARRGSRRRLLGAILFTRYVLGLFWQRRNPIDLDSMRRVLRGIFPRAQVLGDKYPRYVFHLDRFAAVPDLLIVVIFREARDVVRSAIEKSKKSWRRTSYGRRFASPTSAAKSWVRAIESMERNRERIHVIRYEDLVRQPEAVLRDLGRYLEVDPEGFKSSIIKQDRVGKHKKGLSDADQATVVQVAGEAMRRQGYL
jgi:hypothetical protein